MTMPRFERDELVYGLVLVGQKLDVQALAVDAEAEIARLAATHGVPLVWIAFPHCIVVGLVPAYVSADDRHAVEVPKEPPYPSDALWAEVSRLCGQPLQAPTLWLVAPGILAQAHLVEEAEEGSELYGQDMDQVPWDDAVIGHELACANFEEPLEPLDPERLSQARGRLVLVARYD